MIKMELEQINSAKKLAEYIKNNHCVVIKISANWCGPCKNTKFLEMYNNMKNIYTNTNIIKFIELDIDDDSYIIDSKEYFDIIIDSVPTFLISTNGNFTRKYSGANLEPVNKFLLELLQINTN